MWPIGADRDFRQSLLRITLHLRDVEANAGKATGTRAQILAVAMSLFTKKGYAGTSMREIAAQVGIKAASLYSHVPEGKEQLLRLGLHSILNEFLAFLIGDIRFDMDAGEQLRSVLAKHVTWQLDFGEQALAWDAAINQFGVAGVLDEATIESVRSEQRLYHDYLRDLVAEGSPGQPTEDLATVLLVICDHAHRWLPGAAVAGRVAGPISVADRNYVIDRVWRIVSIMLEGARHN